MSFFQTLVSEEDIERICDAREEISYSKGQIINIEGDKVTDFKYLKNGLVKLFKRSGNGDEQIIAITRPYEVAYVLVYFSSEERMYPEDLKWYRYFDEVGRNITGYEKAGDVYNDYGNGEPLFGHGPDFGYWYYGAIWYGDELWNGARNKDYDNDGDIDQIDMLACADHPCRDFKGERICS